MDKNKKKATGWDARGRCELRNFFEFYALLATQFSLRLWLFRLRGGQRYAPRSVTVLTALTIHLFDVKKPSAACFAYFQAKLELFLATTHQLAFVLECQ